MEEIQVNPHIYLVRLSCAKECVYSGRKLKKNSFALKIRNVHKTRYIHLKKFQSLHIDLNTFDGSISPIRFGPKNRIECNPNKELSSGIRVSNDTCLVCDKIEAQQKGWLCMGTKEIWIPEECITDFVEQMESVYSVVQQYSSEVAAQLV